jgi:hypothetical protein
MPDGPPPVVAGANRPASNDARMRPCREQGDDGSRIDIHIHRAGAFVCSDSQPAGAAAVDRAPGRRAGGGQRDRAALGRHVSAGVPHIARGLSTSASQVQLTLTACVAGLALGQLLLGPLGVDVHEPGVHLTLDSTAISLDACVEIIAAAAVRR